MATTFQNEEKRIYLAGEINTEVAAAFRCQMDATIREFEENLIPRNERNVCVCISDSPGGSVSAGWLIYDVMRSCAANIRVRVGGMIASMAVTVTLGGDRGKREAYANTEFLMHQPLGGVTGQASDILIQAEHIRKCRTKLYEVYAERTGQTIERIAKDCERDYILTAEEALAYGIIQKIIPNREEEKE